MSTPSGAAPAVAGMRVAHALVLAAAAAGSLTLLVPGLLTGPAAMNGSAKGTSVVILVAAGVLAATLIQVRRGSLTALLLATGAAAYLTYNGVLLVFGTPFNRAFPAYEGQLGLAIWALVSLTRTLWLRGERTTPVLGRGIPVFLLMVVSLNAVAWLSRLVPALVSDDSHRILDGTGLTTSPVYVQDLAFWLPALAWVAVGMWKAHGPRTLLGAAALSFWVLESLSVAADQWWGHRADPSSTVVSAAAVPLFGLVGVITLVVFLVTVHGLRESTQVPADGIPPDNVPLTATRG